MNETRSRVRVGRYMYNGGLLVGEECQTGCPMSPYLYNLLTADMEVEISKGKREENWWAGRTAYTLAYARNVVWLTEEEKDIEMMIRTLERYLGEKRLVLNTEK